MNILIVKLSSVGDVVHALPVAAALKGLYPESRISWVVEPAARTLLSNHKYIDEVLVFEKAKKTNIKYLMTFFGKLRSKKYDLCIDLQGLLKSAVIVFAARAAKKIGWYNLREGSWLVSKPTSGKYRQAHVVERYLDVPRVLGAAIAAGAADFGIGFSQEDIASTQELCANYGLNIETDKYVVLAPGSIWRTKRWPLGRFEQLSAMLATRGIKPVVVGASNETGLAIKNDGRAVNLIGKTTLKQLAYIISKTQHFVGNDSGPAHIAAALNTPVTVLFGPSRYQRTGPYGSNSVVVQTSCEKKECMQRQCPLGKECMNDIGAEEIFAKVMTKSSGGKWSQ